MMAAGYRWGRGSLGEAAKMWHNRRILMLTRASSVTRWRLSGKSRLIGFAAVGLVPADLFFNTPTVQ